MFQQYMGLQTSSGSLTKQQAALHTELTTLKGRLATIHKEGETYDREFIDRSAGKKEFGFFRRNGVTTMQDWLLFIFFVSYAVICIAIIGYYTSTNPFNPFFLGIAVAIAVIFGIMMSAVVIRLI
jgi:hypothetical protein